MADEWQWFTDAAEMASKRKGGCGVGKLIETMRAGEEVGELSKGAADKVIATLASNRVTAPGLLEALRHRLDESWELPSAAVIQRHRKGQCGCGLLEVAP